MFRSRLLAAKRHSLRRGSLLVWELDWWVAGIGSRGSSKMEVRILLGVTLHSEIADGDAELTLTLPYGRAHRMQLF